MTGVTAEIGATVASGLEMVAGTANDSGTITINGVTTGTITLKGNKGQDRNQAVDAINAISGATGVRAVDTGSDSLGLQLVADDGRNIVVSYANSGSTFIAKNVGVNMSNFEVGADPTTNPVSIFTGTFSLQTTTGSPITIGTQVSGNISNSGLTVGSFAPNTSYLTMSPRANAFTTFAASSATGPRSLAAGDLVINGFTIAASISTDDTSSDTFAVGSLKEASGIAIAAAINKSSSQTGVKAVANANSVVGSGFATTAGNYGTLYVNHVAIDIPSVSGMTASTKAIDVVSAINAVAGSTGVIATDNGAGITLTAADGRNISLATSAGDTLTLANLGLVAPNSAMTNRQNPLVAIATTASSAIVNYGGVTLLSDKSFTIAGGANTTALIDLAKLGLQ